MTLLVLVVAAAATFVAGCIGYVVGRRQPACAHDWCVIERTVAPTRNIKFGAGEATEDTYRQQLAAMERASAGSTDVLLQCAKCKRTYIEHMIGTPKQVVALESSTR